MDDHTKYKQVIAKRIREYRLEQEWSQRELARRLNVHASQIGRWESGRHLLDLHLAYWLAKTLKVSMDDLFGE